MLTIDITLSTSQYHKILRKWQHACTQSERERELQFQPDNEGMKHFQTNHHEGLHTHQLVLSGHVASPAKEFVRSANGKILKVKISGTISNRQTNIFIPSSPYARKNKWKCVSAMPMEKIIPVWWISYSVWCMFTFISQKTIAFVHVYFHFTKILLGIHEWRWSCHLPSFWQGHLNLP